MENSRCWRWEETVFWSYLRFSLLLHVLSKLSSANGCVKALGSATMDLHHSALQQRVGDSEGAGQEPLKDTTKFSKLVKKKNNTEP